MSLPSKYQISQMIELLGVCRLTLVVGCIVLSDLLDAHDKLLETLLFIIGRIVGFS